MRVLRLTLVLVFVFSALPLLAQGYFGQNKVRYKDFDFRVLKTQHFDIYYYPEEAGMAPQLGRMAERWYTRFAGLLQHQLSSRQVVIAYASGSDFRSTTVIPEYIGEATGGVTEALRRRIVMPMAGPLKETDHVLGHELVHAFQYDMTTNRRPGAGAGVPGAAMLPLWFIEGMAEYLSLGPIDANTAMWMRDAVRQEKLPSLKDLGNTEKYFPYRWGQAFWAYVGGRYGDRAIGQILRQAGGSGRVEAALENVAQIKPEQLTREWHRAMTDLYEPQLAATQPPASNSRTLIATQKNEHTLNASPAISPDGKWMVYFSSRDLFGVDLYLADATTGHIKRRLTRSDTNPHLDSLVFVNSAGAWSSDSKRFAFPAISGARAQIRIYDIDRNDVTTTLPVRGVDEIYNPTWSPDGQQIAFSAMTGGTTDLFVADLKQRSVRRLTHDAFADLQPAWSPDGRRLAFVTDRFTVNVGDLGYGPYRLALMDMTSGRIEPVQGFDEGKHINPQWAADGGSLFFVSDHDGIAQIYRVALAGGAITQVTNIQTGVSGITDLSPAFSLAESGNRLVYSAFLGGDYGIFSIDGAEKLAGTLPKNALTARAGALLPPEQRVQGGNVVAAMLNEPERGIVPGTGFQTTAYHPTLSLDYVAPPSLGVGFSNAGTFVAGGTALYFSDLLNQHQLVVGLQSSNFQTGSFTRNFAGTVAYQNQKHRWTWGGQVGQVPYITGGGQVTGAVVDGQPVVVQDAITFWQIQRQVAGVVAYPFSRAQRLEFTGGYQNISFAQQASRGIFSAVTGELLAQGDQDLPAPAALNMGFTSAALVYDTSIFGGTSPIAGQRYRLEAGVSGGSLNFSTLLADYRRYFRIARPLTLAFRGLTYGRYGGDSDDPRLANMFLGYSGLVRGYDPNSFNPRECGTQTNGSSACPVFDQLVGSRLGVVNAEARVPLLGYLGIIPSRALPPVEVAGFFDGGAAWTRLNSISFSGPRHAVSSYGAALRVNILGYAVGEVSLVHPNDRPFRNWLWQFTLAPGF